MELYSIHDEDGVQETSLDQSGSRFCPEPNSGSWIPIGSGKFTTDGSTTIRVTHTASQSCWGGHFMRYVNVDAIRLSYEAAVSTEAVSRYRS
jgi:hypothetical protein